jgi:ribosomal protein L37AE/L43A
MRVSDLALSESIKRRLASAGFLEVDQLTSVVPREVLAISGFGETALSRIIGALAAQGLQLSEDSYAPYICAREGHAAHDVKLTDLWLCTECGEDFATRPFAGEKPAYVGQPIGGYCQNCVENKASVALRQWYLCAACARVAQSFGQSVIASRELVRTWNSNFAGVTGIELVETDPPRLNRRAASVRVADKLSQVDFEGRAIGSGVRVFGIEQKTGQKGLGHAAVNPMSEFQLDCSDCDDIAAVAERERLPVYLIHAQAIQRAAPPTRLWVPVGYWWTDAYAMRDHCNDVRNRSREPRPAAYYDVRIFRPLADFAEYIRSGGVEAFRRQVEADGRFPPMYPNQARQVRQQP